MAWQQKRENLQGEQVFLGVERNSWNEGGKRREGKTGEECLKNKTDSEIEIEGKWRK